MTRAGAGGIIFRQRRLPMVKKSGLMLLATIGLLGIAQAVIDNEADAQSRTTTAPRFEVDPLWPKPLPNHWLMGQTIGVSVDAQDHIWIIHRAGSLEAGEQHLTAKIAQCCAAAPPVLVFDQAGNLINSWGGKGQGYDWPDSNHG